MFLQVRNTPLISITLTSDDLKVSTIHIIKLVQHVVFVVAFCDSRSFQTLKVYYKPIIITNNVLLPITIGTDVFNEVLNTGGKLS